LASWITASALLNLAQFIGGTRSDANSGGGSIANSSCAGTGKPFSHQNEAVSFGNWLPLSSVQCSPGRSAELFSMIAKFA
jgi:hypothetical protein